MQWGRKVDPVRLSMRRLLMLGLVVLILFAAAGVWSAYQKERESAALRVESQNSLENLSSEHDQLVANIATLQTDRGKEAALRQEYAVGKKGEQLVIIVGPSTDTPAQATTTILQKIERAFWWW